MTPERMARLVAAWVRFYTRRQPPAVAQRRREEIDADLHDQIAHEREAGTSERRIALSIAGRMVNGSGIMQIIVQVLLTGGWLSLIKQLLIMSLLYGRINFLYYSTGKFIITLF